LHFKAIIKRGETSTIAIAFGAQQRQFVMTKSTLQLEQECLVLAYFVEKRCTNARFFAFITACWPRWRLFFPNIRLDDEIEGLISVFLRHAGAPML
jgi:hypothetical protein